MTTPGFPRPSNLRGEGNFRGPTERHVRALQNAMQKLQNEVDALEDDVSALGTWTTWTPTVTGMVNRSTMDARYVRVGDIVFFDIYVILSGGVTGPVTFTMPVTPRSAGASWRMLGQWVALDTGVARYQGSAAQDGNVIRIVRQSEQLNNISATTPFTWASADQFRVTGWYEAAE